MQTFTTASVAAVVMLALVLTIMEVMRVPSSGSMRDLAITPHSARCEVLDVHRSRVWVGSLGSMCKDTAMLVRVSSNDIDVSG